MFYVLEITIYKSAAISKRRRGRERLKNFFHLQALPPSIFFTTFESLFDFKRIFHRLEKSLSFNYPKRSPNGGFVIDVAKKKSFPKYHGLLTKFISTAGQFSDSFNNSNFNLGEPISTLCNQSSSPSCAMDSISSHTVQLHQRCSLFTARCVVQFSPFIIRKPRNNNKKL